MNLIAVPTSLARPRQIAGLFEVADDSRRRAFGDTDRGGDVSEPCVRVGADALEYVRVICHEPPKMIAPSCS